MRVILVTVMYVCDLGYGPVRSVSMVTVMILCV